MIEVGLFSALILWIAWLGAIPLINKFGNYILATLVLASMTNLIICLASVGVTYAIWRYYASVLLLIIASIIAFFTYFFKW